ncbi:MAG: zf-HC2 domain-containing protein [Labilithrix sp.]|nr:zf-HC2 domain-containing protein [Labilithrix sp.]MCW5810463.1 zf-HC2 domain-containing protein [Labilithrix sp.]
MNPSDSRCSSIARLLGAHADGQLDAAKTVEIDDHLGACETCRERTALDRAIRGSLKKSVKTTAPTDLRTRLLAAMTAEVAQPDAEAEPGPREAAAQAGAQRPERASARAVSRGGGVGGEAPDVDKTPKPKPRPAMLRHWRTAIPVASAAAIALAWGFAARQPMAAGDAHSSARAGFGNDELVKQFVDVHSRPIRPETADSREVRNFEREVGVPVHVPQLEKNARFVGGRLLPVQGGERAAMLQYEVVRPTGDVQRVSVFIYDPRRVQIRSAEQLPPRAVGTAEVRVGQARGYSVAVAQHGDVGYAVASDLDDSTSAQYVAAVERE